MTSLPTNTTTEDIVEDRESNYDFSDDVRYLEDFGYLPPVPVGIEFHTGKAVDDWFLGECQRPLTEDDIPF